ncbi:alpha/beta hydrolase [uncultured Campylobacter sp.]|uniref:alpha/beta hydrolase n=1 Tax=uncultured Campylobacter sp. TaxID=218934 RepID=UPI002631F61F|nr:alpha/beta hydrolase [uncultured Campylobacter sp.]
MQKSTIEIRGIPAAVWGSCSKKVYIYAHGQGGSKDDAELLASVVCEQGWQVISFDLPGHGQRKHEPVSCESIFYDPRHTIFEFREILSYAKKRWEEIALFAVSIGAWFSLQSFRDEKFSDCLFVSPILDMKYVISNIMRRAGVSEERLKQERMILTPVGQPLFWEYWSFVLNNPITKWKTPSRILYAKNDDITPLYIAKNFAQKFDCDLSVMKNGEHWFHTPQQLDYLRSWIKSAVENRR